MLQRCSYLLLLSCALLTVAGKTTPPGAWPFYGKSPRSARCAVHLIRFKAAFNTFATAQCTAQIFSTTVWTEQPSRLNTVTGLMNGWLQEATSSVQQHKIARPGLVIMHAIQQNTLQRGKKGTQQQCLLDIMLAALAPMPALLPTTAGSCAPPVQSSHAPALHLQGTPDRPTAAAAKGQRHGTAAESSMTIHHQSCKPDMTYTDCQQARWKTTAMQRTAPANMGNCSSS